jgi:branched-chain amino acid transport system substrate-binding protein
MKKLLLSIACSTFLYAGASNAQYSDGVVRIGVLTDMTGVVSNLLGAGSVVAAQLAVEDFGGKIGNTPIELVSADHQMKPDVASSLARRWFDEGGVDAIADVPGSGIALAVSGVVKEKNKVFLATGAGVSRLTGDLCSPNTVHWAMDTYAAVRSLARTISGDKKQSSWFLFLRDDAYGKDVEMQIRSVVATQGGTITGLVRHPVGTPDFSSFLLQAQSSGADLIVVGNAGDDFINTVKQASEYRILRGKQRIFATVANLLDFRSIGLDVAAGLFVAEPFYWDLNDGTRAFSRRFAQRNKGQMPSQYQADVYSGITHYLKTVAAMGTDGDGRAVVAKMKKLPTDDPIHGHGYIREDGRKMHPTYLFQVKRPEESKGEWDIYKLINTVAVEDAWRPLAESQCPLIQAKK